MVLNGGRQNGLAVELSTRTIAQVYATSEIIAWQDSYRGSVEWMSYGFLCASRIKNRKPPTQFGRIVAGCVVVERSGRESSACHTFYSHSYNIQSRMCSFTQMKFRWKYIYVCSWRWPKKMGKPAQQPNAYVSEQSVHMHTAPRVHYIRFVSC